MSLVASILDSLLATRTRVGTFECPCGAVKCELKIPASSFALIDQTTALCHCDDCVGFCQACPNGNYVIENYATHLVNFYKSDVTVINGQDMIQGVKLKESAVAVRLYCKQCGTPLGAEVTVAPMVLLYAKLITQGPIYLPSLVLGQKWAPPEARSYAGGNVVVMPGIFNFFFLLKLLGRAFLGHVFGKNGPCMLNGADSYKAIPVGFHTIMETMRANKKGN